MKLLGYVKQILEDILPFPMINFKPEMTFVQLGLDSLLISTMETKLRQEFKVPHGFLLVNSSPKKVVSALLQYTKKGKSKSLENNRIDKLDLGDSEPSEYPLSSAQKRLWIEMLSTDIHVFDEHLQITIPNLDKTKLKKAWSLVSWKHSILRTTIRKTKQIVNKVIVEISDDLDDIEGDLIDQKIPIRINTKDDVLYFNYHHLLLDGKSLNIIFKDLLKAYETGKLENDDNSSYGDYCLFEEKYLQNKNYCEDTNFWKKYLNNYEVDEQISRNGDCKTYTMSLNKDVADKLTQILKQMDVTLFSYHCSIVSLLLYRLYHEEDVLMALPVDVNLESQFEKIAGLFFNQTLVRLHPSGNIKLSDYVKSTYKSLNKVKLHSQVPYEVLSKNIVIPKPKIVVIDDKIEPLPKGITVKSNKKKIANEMMIYIQHDRSDITVKVEYDKGKYSKKEIEEVLRCYNIICERFCKEISISLNEICFVKIPEIAKPILENYLDRILQKLNLSQNEKILIKTSEDKITVKEFNNEIILLSTNLNNYCQKNKIQNKIIGIKMERAINLVITVVLIWKAGFTPLILDFDWPEDDINNIITDNNIEIVITDDKESNVTFICFSDLKVKYGTSFDKLSDIHSDDNDYNNIAYAAFTSGSTGKRKLILNNTEALNNLLTQYSNFFSYNEQSVVYQVVNPAFDIFYADIVCALSNGSTLYLAKHKIPSIKEIGKLKFACLI